MTSSPTEAWPRSESEPEAVLKAKRCNCTCGCTLWKRQRIVCARCRRRVGVYCCRSLCADDVCHRCLAEPDPELAEPDPELAPEAAQAKAVDRTMAAIDARAKATDEARAIRTAADGFLPPPLMNERQQPWQPSSLPSSSTSIALRQTCFWAASNRS